MQVPGCSNFRDGNTVVESRSTWEKSILSAIYVGINPASKKFSFLSGPLFNVFIFEFIFIFEVHSLKKLKRKIIGKDYWELLQGNITMEYYWERLFRKITVKSVNYSNWYFICIENTNKYIRTQFILSR